MMMLHKEEAELWKNAATVVRDAMYEGIDVGRDLPHTTARTWRRQIKRLK